jgi:1-acyl-sn-glycerol-3-phosphate acyltransferase
MRYSVSEWFLRYFFRGLTGVLCKIDDQALDKVPPKGPLILVTNHVNVLEIPLIYTRLRPRPVSGFFAAYRLENPFLRWLLHSFNGIPVRRGEVDRVAIRQALARIKAGAIFAMAPEGTRNPEGHLQQGRAGVVWLAEQSGAPIQPLVHFEDVHWQEQLKRFRRVPFHIAVGRPFRIETGDVRMNGDLRQAIADEIMLQMARLLPESYHGYYSGREATMQHLCYLDEKV